MNINSKSIIGTLLSLVMGGALIFYGLSGLNPEILGELDVVLSSWETIALTAIIVVAVVTFFTYGFYILARLSQWKFIDWFDKRQLPVIKAKRLNEQQPIKITRFGSPDLKIAPPGATQKEHGQIDFMHGETVMGFFFPSWEVYTHWPGKWMRLGNVFFLSIIITAILSFSVYPVIVTICFLGILLSSVYIGLLLYWGWEWIRYSEFLIITNYRYIKADANFSWSGLFQKKGSDIAIRYTDVGDIDNIDPAGLPKAYGIRMGFLKEYFLEMWSRGPSKVGSIAIRSRSHQGAEFFESYSFAPTIYSTLKSAQSEYYALTRLLEKIDSEAAGYVIGKPGSEDLTDSERERLAYAWKKKQYAHYGITDPYEFDVFEFRRKILNLLSSPIQEVVVPNSVQSLSDNDTDSTNVARHFTPATPESFEIAWRETSPHGKISLQNSGFSVEEIRDIHEQTILGVRDILEKIREGQSKQQIMQSLETR